jgi:DinB superfamily
VADSAEIAQQITEARARLIDFARGCTDEQWVSAPLAERDPRPTCVIVDHVAHAYEYIAGWIRPMAAGETVEVTEAHVDSLNAEHAGSSGLLTRDEVVDHLNTSGDSLIALVRGLGSEQLAMGSGRVEGMAKIAARHADSHRSELEAAFA